MQRKCIESLLSVTALLIMQLIYTMTHKLPHITLLSSPRIIRLSGLSVPGSGAADGSVNNECQSLQRGVDQHSNVEVQNATIG